MPVQPQSKTRIQTQKGAKNMQQYLQELESLLKRNTGTGLFSAEDTSSNTPMYIPGKVNNPGGIESNAAAISADPRESVIPDFQMPEYQQEEQQPDGQGDQADNMSVSDFIDQFTQAVYSPQRASSEELQQKYQQSGQKYGIQSLLDGRTKFNDGSIGINEEKDPNAIASMRDGSILWDDGFTREAPPQGMQGQLAGTDGLSQFLFGRKQAITQPYGNVNPIEPTPGNVNYGTDFRTRDLENRQLKLPVQTKILQILRDDGTRFGTISGHKGYGNSVLLELPSGERIRLSHLSNLPNFEQGQEIPAETVIGTPGTTGNTYGEHLDVEYYNKEGKISNPKEFLQTGAREYSQSSPITGVSPYLQRDNMSVDPRVKQEKPIIQGLQSINPQTSQDQPSYNPDQALPKFTQEVKKIPQKVAGAIDKANPTGEFDLGLTEGGFTPEAAQTRMDTAVKFAQPSENRGFLGRFRQSIGNATEQAGNMLGIPETGISEILAGGKTRDTNQAFASELDRSAAQKEQPGQSLNIKQGITDVAQQAGQGVKNLGQAGVDALGAVFKPKQEEQKRAVGDVAGTADPGSLSQFSSLMDGAPSMSKMVKNDTSDPFFKMGGSEMYKSFLKPNAKDLYGGALNMDMFTPEFYKDLGNISSVFGGSKDLGAATERYVENEKQKYPQMSRMNWEEGYDRGEIDNYNRQIDEYNSSINNYLNQIRSSTVGAKSIFTPTQSYSKNIFAKPAAAMPMSQSNTPKMSVAPTISKPQMSVARPSSSPQMSSVSRAPQMSTPPQQSNRPGSSAPQMSVMPQKSAPQMSKAPVMSVAPKVSAPQMSKAPVMSVAPKPAQNMSKAPAPQSKPSSNVFTKVANAIKNVFRR